MPIKTLIADDHAIVRDGLTALLEAQGNCAVIGTASNGRDAVRLAREYKPDLVIMDISMPELNGIEATGQIMQIKPETKVIILSMHSGPEHIFRALKAGARGYLMKESAGKELVQAVRAVTAGNRYLSRKIDDILIDDYIRNREPKDLKEPLERLSSREKEILQLVVEGKSSRKIAETLYLSPKTVETYRSRLMDKLGIRDIPGLVKFAIQEGITSLE
jgi:DNA-binding NarL/FixJ family response regulator